MMMMMMMMTVNSMMIMTVISCIVMMMMMITFLQVGIAALAMICLRMVTDILRCYGDGGHIGGKEIKKLQELAMVFGCSHAGGSIIQKMEKYTNQVK